MFSLRRQFSAFHTFISLICLAWVAIIKSYKFLLGFRRALLHYAQRNCRDIDRNRSIITKRQWFFVRQLFVRTIIKTYIITSLKINIVQTHSVLVLREPDANDDMLLNARGRHLTFLYSQSFPPCSKYQVCVIAAHWANKLGDNSFKLPCAHLSRHKLQCGDTSVSIRAAPCDHHIRRPKMHIFAVPKWCWCDRPMRITIATFTYGPETIKIER